LVDFRKSVNPGNGERDKQDLLLGEGFKVGDKVYSLFREDETEPTSTEFYKAIIKQVFKNSVIVGFFDGDNENKVRYNEIFKVPNSNHHKSGFITKKPTSESQITEKSKKPTNEPESNERDSKSRSKSKIPQLPKKKNNEEHKISESDSKSSKSTKAMSSTKHLSSELAESLEVTNGVKRRPVEATETITKKQKPNETSNSQVEHAVAHMNVTKLNSKEISNSATDLLKKREKKKKKVMLGVSSGYVNFDELASKTETETIVTQEGY
ncbi:hypothetical protein HK096_001561, partial [Nowakowskiella sp. JEL0078]